MNLECLSLVCPSPEIWLPALEATFSKYDISTPTRVAGFLGQVAVESGNFKWVRELWGPTEQQQKYERDFTQPWPSPANKVAYSLGNFQKGDGFLYRGGGLIQTTGRLNYTSLMMALEIDCLVHPELIESPMNAALSAGHYWQIKNLNAFCDTENWKGLTYKVNGGLTAYTDRLNYTLKILKCLLLPTPT